NVKLNIVGEVGVKYLVKEYLVMDNNEEISSIEANPIKQTEEIDVNDNSGVESKVEKVVEDSIKRRARTEKGIIQGERKTVAVSNAKVSKVESDDESKPEFEKSDVLYTILLFVISFYCMLTISIGDMGTGFAVFVTLFLIGTELFFKVKGKKGTVESTFCFVGLIISAAMFFVFNNDIMELSLLVVMGVLLTYWIGNNCGTLMAKGDKSYCFGDAKNILFSTPFENFTIAFSSVKSGKSKKGFKKLGPAVIGFVVMIPVLIIVIISLMNADPEFEAFMHKLFSWVEYIDFEVIVKLIISIPFALYLGGLVLGNMYNSYISRAIRYNNFNSDKEYFDYRRETRRVVSHVTIGSAITSINFIYVLFAISQFGYLFKAFAGVLPEEYTYSEYAKKGFYEMFFVVCINIVILAITRMITKRKENEDITGYEIRKAAQKFVGEPFEVTGYNRFQNILLCIFTIVLILTAESKMVMYINAYGLTRSRTYLSCIMIFILFSMILVAVRQARRFDVLHYIIVAGTFTILVMSVANIDGIIARYNIHKYEKELDANKKNAELDFECLSNLGDGACNALKDFYYSDYATTEDKCRIVCILFGDYVDYDDYEDYSGYVKVIKEYMNDRDELFEYEDLEDAPEYDYNYDNYVKCDIRGKRYSSFNITSFNKCKIRDEIYYDCMEITKELEFSL
ncbi:MAG: DUF4173 domain-containing protein, partial [Lachnospiraceae bacterium]|nr:DUF4173 domain-containing protein [Lachnospiraceae bacterium]